MNVRRFATRVCACGSWAAHQHFDLLLRVFVEWWVGTDGYPWVRWVGWLVSLPAIWIIISTPLTEKAQLLFGLVCFLAAYIFRNLPGRFVTQILVVLSVTASTRYLYWRVTETMKFETWYNAFFGTGLFLAELFAWIVPCARVCTTLGRLSVNLNHCLQMCLNGQQSTS